MARSPIFRKLKKVLLSEGAPVSRRDFLKITAGVGLAYIPAQYGLYKFNLVHPVLRQDPVLILGGGIAGLTAAYQLQKMGLASVIYEGAGRLGGRVFTRSQFNSDGMTAELGGELIDSGHTSVLALAQELGVEMVNFASEPGPSDMFAFHFNRQTYRESDLIKGVDPLKLFIKQDIKNVFPQGDGGSLDYRNHSPAAAKFDRMSLAEYLHKATAHVDPWILDLIRVAYETEFGLEACEQSAINLLSMLYPLDGGFTLFGGSDECIRAKGGNGTLIDALVRATREKVPVELGHRLVKLEKAGTKLRAVFQKGGGTISAEAARVICTLPFSTLREVEGLKTLGLSPVKLNCINELGYGRNAKHLLGFRRRFWREERKGFAPDRGYVFTDGVAENFWDSSRGQLGQSGILTNYLTGSRRTSNLPSLAQVFANLEAIYPGIGQHRDGQALTMAWEGMPLAKGSYACPKVGQHCTIMGAQAEPELGGQLLFAGEHVSVASQGYIDGAVETALAAVNQIQRKMSMGA
jgi:monoamine oxidase